MIYKLTNILIYFKQKLDNKYKSSLSNRFQKKLDFTQIFYQTRKYIRTQT